jgi:hypothetical protein
MLRPFTVMQRMSCLQTKKTYDFLYRRLVCSLTVTKERRRTEDRLQSASAHNMQVSAHAKYHGYCVSQGFALAMQFLVTCVSGCDGRS